MTRRKNVGQNEFIRAWQRVGNRASDKQVRLDEVVAELGYQITPAGVRARYIGYRDKFEEAGMECALFPMHSRGRGAKPLDLDELNEIAKACVPEEGDDSVPAGEGDD